VLLRITNILLKLSTHSSLAGCAAGFKNRQNTIRHARGPQKELDLGIATCELRIQNNEKWIIQEVKRRDSLAEEGMLETQGFGGFEVRKTTALVGAEDDRKLLHSLLLKKAPLSGTRLGAANFCLHLGFGNAYQCRCARHPMP
jgi:hypothetical protein